MSDFSKRIRENMMVFQSDMIQMLTELHEVISNNIGMSEDCLTNHMRGIFNYLFEATVAKNIYYNYPLSKGKWLVDIAVSTSEISYKNHLADIVIEMKKPTVALKERECQQLIRYMINAKASWGILTNGNEMIFYKLIDLVDNLNEIYTTEYNIKKYAFLSLSVESVVKQEPEALKELNALKDFTDTCFGSDANIESIRNTEFTNEQKAAIKSVQEREEKEYNELFYFDKKFLSTTVQNCINCFSDTDKKSLIDRVLIEDIDYFYTGVDLLSVPFFFMLSEEDREGFIDFSENFQEILLKLFKLRNNQVDMNTLKSIFLEDFKALMGYQMDDNFIDVMDSCFIDENIANGVDNSILFFIHHCEDSSLNSGCTLLSSKFPVVVETNGWSFVIRTFNYSSDSIYLTFDVQNMTFGNMFDLFLLSKKKFNENVIRNIEDCSCKLMGCINNTIKRAYAQRNVVSEYLIDILLKMEDAGINTYSLLHLLPEEEYKLITGRDVKLLPDNKQENVSAEYMILSRSYDKCLDRIIEYLNIIGKKIDSSFEYREVNA